ncbi:2-C-methyl-D-erythritol 2,4-cyclodiphosphate synthase [Victivallis vadensis]|uniref:2-C-methyl-D-erythritol 2,4-cyclodiphosphate synthase n=1 Tax=Victivallis vadensis TaxID=172901 RepID=A0A2U1AUG2_9BACT|nr:2-C-methyl-D-erythritol 2,4-cyclodiphosphate synthase [Victivallis vadensis]PVY40033.1 2-C-methyl-D-erythritol 2,4-cyclodiphosphate synthase [Victivallis vadensis]PWM89470.1 MAG: 2-C-methyl-D-erythritol 2,4-cyclodiphosphate synthase [Lentisphaerota bacterium]
MFRIGQGYDVHRLVPGRELVLCGVKIPHSTGLLGHSDADVAVHALMDALIGALALGDIGGFFPDTDPAYAGADSMKLLEQVLADPRVRDWRVENLDLTIVAQKPRLLPYRETMRQNLAAALRICVGQVSVKATTTEKLGFEGREEGISASCVVLLSR